MTIANKQHNKIEFSAPIFPLRLHGTARDHELAALLCSAPEWDGRSDAMQCNAASWSPWCGQIKRTCRMAPRLSPPSSYRVPVRLITRAVYRVHGRTTHQASYLQVAASCQHVRACEDAVWFSVPVLRCFPNQWLLLDRFIQSMRASFAGRLRSVCIASV